MAFFRYLQDVVSRCGDSRILHVVNGIANVLVSLRIQHESTDLVWHGLIVESKRWVQRMRFSGTLKKKPFFNDPNNLQ